MGIDHRLIRQSKMNPDLLTTCSFCKLEIAKKDAVEINETWICKVHQYYIKELWKSIMGE